MWLITRIKSLKSLSCSKNKYFACVTPDMFIGIELKINWQFSVYIKVFLNHPASSQKFLWFVCTITRTPTIIQAAKATTPLPDQKKALLLIHLSYYYFLFVFGYLTYIHTKSVFFSFHRARVFLFFSFLFQNNTPKRDFCSGKAETCDKCLKVKTSEPKKK